MTLTPEQKSAICPWMIFFSLLVILAAVLIFEDSRVQEEPENRLERNLENQKSVIIQGNSIKAVYSSETIHTQVLGCLIETHYPNDKVLAELLEHIIDCENPKRDPTACNWEYGCCSGIGMAQIVPSTGKYCEEMLGRELDLFNKEDNLACAMWLLENEGIQHWGCPDCDWGTYWCWAKYIIL